MHNIELHVQVELVCRVATVLLQTHHNQLVATLAARPVLTILKDILYERVKVISGASYTFFPPIICDQAECLGVVIQIIAREF